MYVFPATTAADVKLNSIKAVELFCQTSRGWSIILEQEKCKEKLEMLKLCKESLKS